MVPQLISHLSAHLITLTKPLSPNQPPSLRPPVDTIPKQPLPPRALWFATSSNVRACPVHPSVLVYVGGGARYCCRLLT